jgi:hypothetical protein
MRFVLTVGREMSGSFVIVWNALFCLPTTAKLRQENSRRKLCIEQASRAFRVSYNTPKQNGNGTNSFQNSAPAALHEVEKQQILRALEQTGWHRGKQPNFSVFHPRLSIVAYVNMIWKSNF